MPNKKGKKDLPDWVQAWRRDIAEGNPVNDLVSALEIAWKALQRIDEKSLVYHAKAAISDIEKLGDD